MINGEIEVLVIQHPGQEHIRVRAINRSTNVFLFESFISPDVRRIVMEVDHRGPRFQIEREVGIRGAVMTRADLQRVIQALIDAERDQEGGEHNNTAAHQWDDQARAVDDARRNLSSALDLVFDAPRAP